jgi:DNA polymerase III gamma/tau subunit
VLEIDGASNNGVEQVRELRTTFVTHRSSEKSIMIDEVDMPPGLQRALKTSKNRPSM